MWSPVVRQGAAPAGPCSRAKHSATLLGGYLYVLGGRSGNVPLRDFWRYSLADGAWLRVEPRGEAPPALQEHSAVAHRHRVYVFGGELGFSSTETPLWVFDTQTMWWRKLGGCGGDAGAGRGRKGAGVAPRGRRGHSAHVLGDIMLVYGGYMDLKGSCNEMWAFHFETESWHLVEGRRGGTRAPARHRHAAALHDRRLYVHAGMQDLRECSDLWKYDTVSRSWSAVKCKVSPGPLHGHVAVRVPGYLYVFGGESNARLNNDLWKFHFATETWERVTVFEGSWPTARADAAGLLTSDLPPRRRPSRTPHREAVPSSGTGGFLRDLTRLSQLNLQIRRGARCSYTALPERDSNESLRRAPSPPPAPRRITKSQSSYAVERRRPVSCGGAIRSPVTPQPANSHRSPPTQLDICREPISVPDFADLVLPTPVLSPTEAAKLVYLDPAEEEEMRREDGFRPPKVLEPIVKKVEIVERLPNSSSVRFRSDVSSDVEDWEMSTSDYASAERVNRLSGASAGSHTHEFTHCGRYKTESQFGFSNPHYLGPDVQELSSAAVAALNTPDSGVGETGGEVELVEMATSRPVVKMRQRREEWEEEADDEAERAVSLLVVGGRELPHLALTQRPLALWSYRL